MTAASRTIPANRMALVLPNPAMVPIMVKVSPQTQAMVRGNPQIQAMVRVSLQTQVMVRGSLQTPAMVSNPQTQAVVGVDKANRQFWQWQRTWRETVTPHRIRS